MHQNLEKSSWKKTCNELEKWVTVNVFNPGVTIEDIKNINPPRLKCVSQIPLDNKSDLKAMIPIMKGQKHKQFYGWYRRNIKNTLITVICKKSY